MKRTLFLLMICILFLLPSGPAAAQTQLAQTTDIVLSPIDIVAEMHVNGSTTLTVDAIVNNEGDSAVSSLECRVDSMSVELIKMEIDGELTDGLVTPQDRFSLVSSVFPSPLAANESLLFHMELRAADLQEELSVGIDGISLQGDFMFYVRPLTLLNNLTFTAILPPFAMLSQESLGPLFPSTNLNFTNGQSLAFIWEIQSLQPGQEKVFIVLYQIPNAQIDSPTFSVLNGILLALLGVAIGVVLAIGGPKLLARAKRMGEVQFVGVTSEEEEVIEIIRRKGGSCSQKELYTGLNLSQAKVSIMLNNLEERGVVRRFREGRENMVYLIEKP